jgi:hypothetical protein
MTPFNKSSTRRSTTIVILLVWLFAVASGVANACVLEATEHHHGSTEDHTSTLRADSEWASGQSEADAIPIHSSSDPSKAPCQRVCDDGVQTLLKHPSGIDLTDCGQAPFVSIVWSLSAQPISDADGIGDLSLPAAGPPIRVLFSRLAL